MRGRDQLTASMFSYMSCKAHVPAGHPLRVTRAIVDEALDVMSADFEGFTLGWDAPRSRRRICCVLCCCRRSTASGLFGSRWFGVVRVVVMVALDGASLIVRFILQQAAEEARRGRPPPPGKSSGPGIPLWYSS